MPLLRNRLQREHFVVLFVAIFLAALVTGVLAGMPAKVAPAHAQSTWKSTLTLKSNVYGTDDAVNTVGDLWGCEDSRWQYEVAYYIQGTGGNCEGSTDLYTWDIPCQPSRSSDCPVYLEFDADVPDGCTIAWFTDRDPGPQNHHDIAECGTSSPVADTAYGTDMKWTGASELNPDVTATYEYGLEE